MFIYGSKDSKSRPRTLKLHDWFKSYDNFNNVFFVLDYFFFFWNHSTVDNLGVSKGRSVSVGLLEKIR